MELPRPITAFVTAMRSSSPRARIVRSSLGLLVFVVVTWWAWTSVGGIEVDWWWTTMLFVICVPISFGIIAVEQHLSTWLADVSVSYGSSFRTSIVASAANYLPIPGAAFVRIGALSKAGSSTGHATVVAIWLGLEWLAITAVVVAPPLVLLGFLAAGVVVGAMGVVATVGMSWWFLCRFPGRERAVWWSLVVVVVKVVFGGFMTYAGLRAVGATMGASLSLVVSASNVLASAVGVFPGGLGIREFFSGLLASVGNFDGATAALGAVVIRATTTVGLGIAFAWIAMVQRGREQSLDVP